MKGGKTVLKQVNILQRFWKIIVAKLGFTCPSCSKANLLTTGCGEGKYSIYCRVSSKEKEQLTLKRPKLPDEFQGRVF